MTYLVEIFKPKILIDRGLCCAIYFLLAPLPQSRLGFAPRSQSFAHVALQQCAQSARYPNSLCSVRTQIRSPQGGEGKVARSFPFQGKVRMGLISFASLKMTSLTYFTDYEKLFKLNQRQFFLQC